MPTLGKEDDRHRDGWLLEAAGMIPVDPATGQPTETPTQCMIGEIEAPPLADRNTTIVAWPEHRVL